MSSKRLRGSSQTKRRRSRRVLNSERLKAGSSRSLSKRKTVTSKQIQIPGLQNENPYSQLDRQSNEIRVLILQPGNGTDQVRCTLETYRLDDCPPFEALSYAWGSSELVEPVLINGSQVMVTYNLGLALQHLRYAQGERTLWVDAVCINQADVQERNHQVFMMNQIYSAANQVLVWLGEARNQSDAAMDVLRELGETRVTPSGKKESLRLLIYDALISRDWWGRLWIVQEVMLARSSPLFICGFRSLAWDTFMEGCNSMGIGTIYSEYGADKRKRSLNWYNLYFLRKILRPKDGPQTSTEISESLNRLLAWTKDFDAKDPRDKVYGCLGLVARSVREVIKPDYQKTAQQLYLEVTMYLLEHDSHSFFARYSIYRSGRSHCPSWVPNFSAQETLRTWNPATFMFRQKQFTRGRRRLSFRNDNRTLAIEGAFIDRIEITVELKDRMDLLLNQIAELDQLLQHGAERKMDPNDPRFCFQKLRKREDLVEVLTGGPGPAEEGPGLRDQYDEYTRGGKSVMPFELEGVLNCVLPGRCFFITEMGFVGTAVSKVRKNDIVTCLFGEMLPMILRPQGASYRMISAAYVPGLMKEEVPGDMCERGLVEKTTFLIR